MVARVRAWVPLQLQQRRPRPTRAVRHAFGPSSSDLVRAAALVAGVTPALLAARPLARRRTRSTTPPKWCSTRTSPRGLLNPRRSSTTSPTSPLRRPLTRCTRRRGPGTRSLAASCCAVWPSVMSLAAPLLAGLVRPPDIHDLDGQVASSAEHLVRYREPGQQTRPARASARPDHELAGPGLTGRPDQPGSRVVGPDLAQGPAQLAEQRRSFSSRAFGGRSRLSSARTCTPWSLASDSPARWAA